MCKGNNLGQRQAWKVHVIFGLCGMEINALIVLEFIFNLRIFYENV